MHIINIRWDDPFVSQTTKITKSTPQLVDPTIPNSFILISAVLIAGLLYWWILPK